MSQFYGRLEKCVPSAGKTHVHKIPLFLGGGILGFGGGGGGRFYFYGRADFSEKVTQKLLSLFFSLPFGISLLFSLQGPRLVVAWAIRNAIRANRSRESFAIKTPIFIARIGRFARIARIIRFARITRFARIVRSR